MSLVDPNFELIDPCPDIFALFRQFDTRFFEGKLACCEVRWSPRMTTCAGICVYEGRGGLCSVRLSKPLLTLRPRRDLVETLLHEMIHAYLFVTQRFNIRDGKDGHGPMFQSHMYRINSEASTNITIYHSFHAEVAVYKQHWWRCTGRCRNERPFYGWVKRASNRAPGPNDLWWDRHRMSCGGSFEKVKEPEGYGQKKKKNNGEKVVATKKPVNNLDKYFSPEKSSRIGVINGLNGSISAPAPAGKIGQSSSSAIGSFTTSNGRINGVIVEKTKKATSSDTGTSNTYKRGRGGGIIGSGRTQPSTSDATATSRSRNGNGNNQGDQTTRRPGIFGTGMAIRGGGSRTVTAGVRGGAVSSSSPTKTTTSPKKSDTFTGTGQKLGGGTGCSRLLDLLETKSQSHAASCSSSVELIRDIDNCSPPAKRRSSIQKTPSKDHNRNRSKSPRGKSPHGKSFRGKSPRGRSKSPAVLDHNRSILDWVVSEPKIATPSSSNALDETDDAIQFLDDLQPGTSGSRPLANFFAPIVEDDVRWELPDRTLDEVGTADLSLLDSFIAIGHRRHGREPQVECPGCSRKLQQSKLNAHLDKCLD